MLFVLENIVKRLTWLILLAFPALVCAQEGSEPPGDTEVVPAVTAGEDDEKSGDAPQEPGGADRQQDEKEKAVDEDNPADWPGLLACCGLWGMIPIILVIIFLIRRANAQKRTQTLSGIAAELNLEFSPMGEESLEGQLDRFRCSTRAARAS